MATSTESHNLGALYALVATNMPMGSSLVNNRVAAVWQQSGDGPHTTALPHEDGVVAIVFVAQDPLHEIPLLRVDGNDYNMTPCSGNSRLWRWPASQDDTSATHFARGSAVSVIAPASGTTLLHFLFIDIPTRDKIRDYPDTVRGHWMIPFGDLRLPSAVHDATAKLWATHPSAIRPLMARETTDDVFASDTLQWRTSDAPFAFIVAEKLHTAVTEPVMAAVAGGALGSMEGDTCSLPIGPIFPSRMRPGSIAFVDQTKPAPTTA